MDKLKMQSPNLVDANIEKIAEMFPNCITEAKDENGILRRVVDFDLLRQELSANLVEGPRERYTLSWPGKNEAILTANAPIAKTLRPCEEESVDFENTKNLYIEGDNLDALKLLQETYLNKIKMFYLDPPYNTGKDFIYEDDFAEDTEMFLKRSNQADEEGNRLVTNTDSNGRFHSDWMSMIYPRLKLARNLLSEDGVIAVSINDVEVENLRLLLNELFGAKNYVNTISVLSKVAAGASGGGEDKRLKKNIEYILIYARNLESFNTLAHLYTNRPLMEVINGMSEEGESWKYTSILLSAGPRKHLCTIKDGDGNPIDIYQREGVERSTINKVSKDESIDEKEAYKKYFSKIFSDTNAQSSIRTRVIDAVGNLGNNEILEVEYVPRSGRDKGQRVTHTYISNTVRRVIWLSEVAELSDGQIIKKEKLGTLWSNFDYNNVGKEGDIPFPDGKKPIDLIATCIHLYNGSDGVFMDFFAGSCSLAHAVIRENVMDGGSRKFVVVQLPEIIDEKNKKYEAAIRYYKENQIPLNVSEIGKERIRRAGKKIKAEWEAKHRQAVLGEGEPANALDIGFRVFKVDTSNMKDVYYTPDELKQNNLELFKDHIKPDRRPEDLLFQVFLDWGLDLTLPIAKETIDGKTVFVVDTNVLLACFDSGITEELVKKLAKHKPLRAVFRDDAFGSDSVKINVEQIFKLLSPGTDVKTL